MRWLAAAAASCAAFAFVVSGACEPIRDAAGLQYLFVPPTAETLFWLVPGVLACLLLLYFAVARAGARTVDAVAGRWLAPLTVPAVVALGLAPAVPGVGSLGAPFGYVFYDLRWWWLGGSAVAVALRIDRALGDPVARRLAWIATWSQPARLLLAEGVVFVGVVTWATATTPHLRFSGELHGDETKYVRYGEVWYQGGGFDISRKTLFSDQPLDASPAVHRSLALLPTTIAQESRTLVSDLRAFAADPSGFRWNRAHGDDAFVVGKRGGTYQIYQAGMSFALFPGYLIDRYLLGLQPGYQDEFPAELVMTNVMLLLMYGACAVAMFRLLRRALGSDVLAAAWAALALVTLPSSAFAFQFYPETLALLIIVSSTSYAMFDAQDAGRRTAAAYGAVAAFLGWLHPRFLLVSVVLLALALTRSRRESRSALLSGAAAVFFTLGAFDYHVTGSWLPTALWDASRPDEAIHPLAVPLNLLGYAFHRTWGLVPHAPILVAAIPGLALLARESRQRAMWIVLIVLALVLPSASHTLSAAGGTPGRLVLAVVPLLVWPAAVLVRRVWHVPACRALVAGAIVLSLDAGTAYNWSHQKAVGALRTGGASGWRPNLLFPIVRDDGWTAPANLAILAALVIVMCVLAVIAFRLPAVAAAPRAPGRSWRSAGLAVASLLALAIGIGTATGRWAYDGYLADRVASHRAAAAGLVALDRCRLCFSSRARAVDWTTLEPNPATGTRSTPRVDGLTLALNVGVEGDGPWTPFGRMRVDFGDRSTTRWVGVAGSTAVSHRYERPGEYAVSVWFQLRDGAVRIERHTVKIGTQGA